MSTFLRFVVLPNIFTKFVKLVKHVCNSPHFHVKCYTGHKHLTEGRHKFDFKIVNSPSFNSSIVIQFCLLGSRLNISLCRTINTPRFTYVPCSKQIKPNPLEGGIGEERGGDGRNWSKRRIGRDGRD